MTTHKMTQIAYDRILIATPFRDAEFHEGIIEGVSFNILFGRKFPATEPDQEPAGAGDMNQQLRVSYDPTTGFSFICSDPDLDFSVVDYHLEIQIKPGLIEGTPTDKATFDALLDRHSAKFESDSWLQSCSYGLVPLTDEPPIGDNTSDHNLTEPGEKAPSA